MRNHPTLKLKIQFFLGPAPRPAFCFWFAEDFWFLWFFENLLCPVEQNFKKISKNLIDFIDFCTNLHFCNSGCKNISRCLCFSIFFEISIFLLSLSDLGHFLPDFSAKKSENKMHDFRTPRKSENPKIMSELMFFRKNLEVKLHIGNSEVQKSAKWKQPENCGGRRTAFS